MKQSFLILSADIPITKENRKQVLSMPGVESLPWKQNGVIKVRLINLMPQPEEEIEMKITIETATVIRLSEDEVLMLRNYLRNPPEPTPKKDLAFLGELFETLPFSRIKIDLESGELMEI